MKPRCPLTMELSHSCQRNRVANLVRRPQHREQQERQENDREHASGPHSGKSISSTSRRSAFQTTAALYSEFLHVPRLATSSMLVDNSANVHVCVHTLSQPPKKKNSEPSQLQIEKQQLDLTHDIPYKESHQFLFLKSPLGSKSRNLRTTN
jgi:hypothetical protein